jgi:hypothetical protein
MCEYLVYALEYMAGGAKRIYDPIKNEIVYVVNVDGSLFGIARSDCIKLMLATETFSNRASAKFYHHQTVHRQVLLLSAAWTSTANRVLTSVIAPVIQSPMPPEKIWLS